MQTQVMIDAARQEYITSTRFDENELARAFNERDFYVAIYRQIATAVADKVVARLAPAIDKALSNIKLTEEINDRNRETPKET